MAAFFVTFFIIFYNVLEMSAPYTDKYSKTVLQTAFFYSPVLPKLPVPRSVPRSATSLSPRVDVLVLSDPRGSTDRRSRRFFDRASPRSGREAVRFEQTSELLEVGRDPCVVYLERRTDVL